MRYSPPKSSAWGHWLRRLKPQVQRERLDAFFERAVWHHEFSSGSLNFNPRSLDPSDVEALGTRFKSLLAVPDQPPNFWHLTEDQFERCYRELVRCPELAATECGVTVGAFYTISAWRVDGAEVPTESAIGSYFGAISHLTTLLSFPDISTFDYLKRTLEELKLCQLNPMHIKKR